MPRRIYLSNKPCFVTSRIQTGLPLVPSLPLNLILNGILAKASQLYPVKLCHYVFMANHFHMIFVPLDPEDASNFIKYVKGESAHAVNRLLGRRQRTVWAKGFDSPVILDAEKCVDKIAYIYANPAKAGLVDSVEEFPGISSWRMFASGKNSKLCTKVPRQKLLSLSSPSLTVGEQQKIFKYFSKVGKQLELHLQPDAWIDCFPGEVESAHAKELILAEVREREALYRKERDEKGRSPIGSLRLRTQSMGKSYISSTFGKRMICLGNTKEIRVRFLRHYLNLCDLAAKVYSAWKLGDLSHRIPPGLFSPKIPPLACSINY